MRLWPQPNGLAWLAIGDQIRFAVYGASGGLVNCSVGYLVKPGSGPVPDRLHLLNDLGLPEPGEFIKVVCLERNWRYAIIRFSAFEFSDDILLDQAERCLNLNV